MGLHTFLLFSQDDKGSGRSENLLVERKGLHGVQPKREIHESLCRILTNFFPSEACMYLSLKKVTMCSWTQQGQLLNHFD